MKYDSTARLNLLQLLYRGSKILTLRKVMRPGSALEPQMENTSLRAIHRPFIIGKYDVRITRRGNG